MEAVVRKDGKVVHINGCGHGSFQSTRYAYHPIPTQLMDGWWKEDNLVADLHWPDDVVRDLDLEKATIDCDTGKAIDEAVHPFTGLQEEIGILRADLAALHVELGVDPTDDLKRLNDIAAEKILAGKEKKEALDESSRSIESAAE